MPGSRQMPQDLYMHRSYAYCTIRGFTHYSAVLGVEHSLSRPCQV